MPTHVLVDPVPNHYLAFGDSITNGGIHVETPYPARLEAKLDIRVAHSDVVNGGNPGERTYGGSERLWQLVKAQKPTYVLIMEGTNDVTDRNDPIDVYNNLVVMIDRARNESGVDGFQIMLATLVPRLDDQNDATHVMNQQAILPAAEAKEVPVCDQWQAFYDYGPWDQLFRDDGKHPNDDGMQLIADTFYDCMLTSFAGVEEETTPPTAWIDSLPAQSECGQIPVGWDGSDNLNWVVDYDVQARTGGGAWTEWLSQTALTGGVYGGGEYNGTVEFRVRGRDLVGNLGAYSVDAASTLVTSDNDPPYDSGVRSLPPVQAAPFPVHWWGIDACGEVTSYAVEFKVGVSGTWQEWLAETTSASADFDPASPAYGETYYFRVRPRDEALNWGGWSDPDAASTLLARHVVGGRAYNVRHQPIAHPDATVSPAPISMEHHPGGRFSAYLAASGDYDVEVNKAGRYGGLPPMQDLPVNDNVTNLEFVLPPHDDAVANGDFEAGTLDSWQLGGSVVPEWTDLSHTGTGAAQVGGGSGDSHLSQTVSPSLPLSDATLSFMVRLAVAGSSSLNVELSDSDPGSPNLVETLTVDTDEWTHVWYDASAITTAPFDLSLSVSNNPAVYVDEVRLGSAIQGQFWAFLPITRR